MIAKVERFLDTVLLSADYWMDCRAVLVEVPLTYVALMEHSQPGENMRAVMRVRTTSASRISGSGQGQDAYRDRRGVWGSLSLSPCKLLLIGISFTRKRNSGSTPAPEHQTRPHPSVFPICYDGLSVDQDVGHPDRKLMWCLECGPVDDCLWIEYD